ncbi:MAG: hypothetical protein DCC75_07975, partial [Proteobacteria bacterium]
DQVGRLLDNVKSIGEYTDILSAVKRARDILQASQRSDAKQLVILMSDGKMEPIPSLGTSQHFARELLENVLPDMKARSLKVYTLAFSDDADKSLLSEIALATEAQNLFTPNADKIHQSFADLFLAVKKPQVIPLSGKGFPIDGDVREATFYINREGNNEVRLRDPKENVFSSSSSPPNIKWFKGEKFDVITVNAPDVGTWHVLDVSSQEGFATLLTNLKLITDWPIVLEAGEIAVLQARLYEGKKPVALPEMSGVIKYAFQITPTDRVAEPIIKEFLVDDGSKGDKIERDGIFSSRVKIEEPGEYKLRVLAKAPTFERQQQIPFRVKPPLLSLEIIADPEGHAAGEEGAGHAKEAHEPEHGQAGEQHGTEQHEAGHAGSSAASGDEHTIFEVALTEEAVSLKNIQVRLTAIDEDRNRFVLPLTRSHSDRLKYEAEASSLPKDGSFELQAQIQGETKEKKPVKDASKKREFTRISSNKPKEEVVVKVEAPPPKQEEKGFPLLELIIVTLVNVGVGVFVLQLLKKSQGAMAFAVPNFEVSPELLKAISDLESKMQLTEIAMTDPLFANISAAAPASKEKAAPQSEAPEDGEEAEEAKEE